jgi:hypothetical protein
VALVLPDNELAHAVDDRESRLPTEAEIAEINRRHLVDTPLQPADLLFVFGSRKDAALRVEEAFKLWREGFFRWGIVSGGVTPGGSLGLSNIRSVICLGNTWTARRYPMTLHRHWPEVAKMLVTVDSFATPRALWHTDPEFSRHMLREWDKIEPYKAKGFIAEWPE